jgi:hypothetical protein
MVSRYIAGGILAALAIAGCNRVAGTEVGNPEIAVSARFVLVDTSANVEVPEMSLKVMGMAYGMAGDSGACWTEPDGHMVDFASPATQSALPMAKAKDAEWTDAEVLLQSPAAAAILPDTAAFLTWYNPRYAKLLLIEGPDTLRALFDMPQGMHLTLGYGKDKVSKWRAGDTMHVKVMFDVGKWAAGIGPKGGWTLRQDGKHVRYALFSEGENAAAWTALKARLPESFLADSASMH